MTRSCALALALAILLLHGASAAAPRLDELMAELNVAPIEPQAAPAFSVTTLDGGRVSLADVKGRAVLVYFWASW